MKNFVSEVTVASPIALLHTQPFLPLGKLGGGHRTLDMQLIPCCTY